jgi:hypothetical protein
VEDFQDFMSKIWDDKHARPIAMNLVEYDTWADFEQDKNSNWSWTGDTDYFTKKENSKKSFKYLVKLGEASWVDGTFKVSSSTATVVFYIVRKTTSLYNYYNMCWFMIHKVDYPRKLLDKIMRSHITKKKLHQSTVKSWSPYYYRALILKELYGSDLELEFWKTVIIQGESK